MHKLTFTLKQHTPIIHFQHEQHGATLRATELKPKLDRFLIKKFKDNGIIYSDWLINGQENALDYKTSIKTQSVYLTPINQSMSVPAFFGNMGGDYQEHPKSLSLTKEPVSVQLLTFDLTLKAKLEEYFPEFIATTNFGTRQSKGYGSFTLWDQNFDLLDNLHCLEVVIPNENEADIFHVINYYHQRLKSGINYKNEYESAFLKLYLNDKPYRWEKRMLKEAFIGGLDSIDEDQRFARAMLGLVGSYTFKPQRENRRPGHVYPRIQVDIDVTPENPNLERFKSPLTYKPVKVNKDSWRIYIILHEVPTAIAGQNFRFDNSVGDRITINTPDNVIDINDLVNNYHIHLGASFRASVYTGRQFWKVNVLR